MEGVVYLTKGVGEGSGIPHSPVPYGGKHCQRSLPLGTPPLGACHSFQFLSKLISRVVGDSVQRRDKKGSLASRQWQPSLLTQRLSLTNHHLGVDQTPIGV